MVAIIFSPTVGIQYFLVPDSDEKIWPDDLPPGSKLYKQFLAQDSENQLLGS